MINNLLVDNNCFMAHCFTLENNKGTIYERISNSIANAATSELCTSTIHIGDITFTNYLGGIGLIIKDPTIIFSCPQDGGTFRSTKKGLIHRDIGTANPSLKVIELAIKERMTYNEFRVVNYQPIGLFFSTDDSGWPIATEAIKSDFKTFYLNTKGFNLPYYFLEYGKLILIEFDYRRSRFYPIRKISLKDLYMKIEEKAKIIHTHFLSEKTISEMQKINCYKEFISALKDSDFNSIDEKGIYFNCFFSPGSITSLRFDLPINSKLINLDINHLKKQSPDERIAMVLHELGHSITDGVDSQLNEFNADDFVIHHGFGRALKESLQKNIKISPIEFDKEITYQRINRIDDFFLKSN